MPAGVGPLLAGISDENCLYNCLKWSTVYWSSEHQSISFHPQGRSANACLEGRGQGDNESANSYGLDILLPSSAAEWTVNYSPPPLEMPFLLFSFSFLSVPHNVPSSWASILTAMAPFVGAAKVLIHLDQVTMVTPASNVSIFFFFKHLGGISK